MTAFHSTYTASDTERALPLDKADKSGSFQVIGVPLFMLAVIAATVLTSKSAVAFAFLPVFIWGVGSGALRNHAGVLIWFLAYFAMEGMYKYLSEFSQAVYVITPLLVAIMVVQQQAKMRQAFQRWKMPPMFRIILVFILWGVAMTFHPLGQGVGQGMVTLLIWYVAPFAMYLFTYNNPLSAKQLTALLLALCGICTVVSAFAIVQYIMGKDWCFSHLPGYSSMPLVNWFVADKHHHITSGSWRPASTGAQGGSGSFWSSIGLVTAIGLLHLPALKPKHKIALGLTLPVHAASLMVGGVRLFVVVSILQILLLIMLNARSRKQMGRSLGIVALLAIGVGIAFTVAQFISGGVLASRYEDTLSNPLARFQQDRGSNVSYLPNFIAEHPLGIGFQRGMTGGKQRADVQEMIVANRETQFNAITGDMGVPGLLLQTALLIGCIVNSWRVFRLLKDPTLKTLSAILFVMISSYLPFCFVGPSLQGAYHFWIIVGLIFTLQGVEWRERASTADTEPMPVPRRSSTLPNRLNDLAPDISQN